MGNLGVLTYWGLMIYRGSEPFSSVRDRRMSFYIFNEELVKTLGKAIDPSNSVAMHKRLYF